MMNLELLCVGSLKERFLREGCGEYIKRLSAYCKLTVKELPEYRLKTDPSPKEIQKGLEKEGDAILSQLSGREALIPLCIEGKTLSSPSFSDYLRQLPLHGKSSATFVIGGSYGLDDRIKKKGDLLLSLSPMTFPHQLTRLILLEQIYRAFSLMSGGKYHK